MSGRTSLFQECPPGKHRRLNKALAANASEMSDVRRPRVGIKSRRSCPVLEEDKKRGVVHGLMKIIVDAARLQSGWSYQGYQNLSRLCFFARFGARMRNYRQHL